MSCVTYFKFYWKMTYTGISKALHFTKKSDTFPKNGRIFIENQHKYNSFLENDQQMFNHHLFRTQQNRICIRFPWTHFWKLHSFWQMRNTFGSRRTFRWKIMMGHHALKSLVLVFPWRFPFVPASGLDFSICLHFFSWHQFFQWKQMPLAIRVSFSSFTAYSCNC